MLFLKCTVAIVTLGFISVGIHDIVFNKNRRLCTVTYMNEQPEENRCEMTYMFNWPQYIPVSLDESIRETYPKYTLNMYGEGQYADELRSLNLYGGIPVLFIPGNAGTLRQVRSLATVALQKAKVESFHFIYFSVGFGDEMSALKGSYIHKQTEFAHICLKIILQLFREKGIAQDSVLVIGYSIGGMIARGLFMLPDFDPSTVRTIITLATPNSMPVITADSDLEKFYLQVNQVWKDQSKKDWLENKMKDLVVVSVGGGCCDIQIRNDLISVKSSWMHNQSIDVITAAMPKVWASTDHESIVWCKQLLLALTRALFDMVDTEAMQYISNATSRMNVLRYHFETSFSNSNSFRDVVNVGSYLISNQNKNCKATDQQSLSFTGKSATTCRLMDISNGNGTVLAIYKGNALDWFAACSNGIVCDTFTSLTKSSQLIPIKNGRIFVLEMRMEKIREHGIYIRFAVDDRINDRLYVKILRNNLPSLVLEKPFLLVSSLGAIVNQRIHTKIKLPFLNYPWIAYRANITSQCRRSSAITAHFHIPWFNEDVFYTTDKIHDISLKFSVERPPKSPEAELQLWFTSTCNFTIETKIDLIASAGQVLKFSYEEILHWMAGFSIILMTLETLRQQGGQSLQSSNRILLIFTSVSISISSFSLPSTLHSWFEYSTFVICKPIIALGIILLLDLIMWMTLSFARALWKVAMFLMKLPFTLINMKRHCCSPVYIKYLLYFVDFILPIIASLWFCGTLGILLALVATFVKDMVVDTRNANALRLSTVMLFIRSPSLIAWIKDFKYSYKLESDQFAWSSVGIVISLFLLHHGSSKNMPNFSREYFITMLILSSMLTCNFLPLYHIPSLMGLTIFIHYILINWKFENISKNWLHYLGYQGFSFVKKNS